MLVQHAHGGFGVAAHGIHYAVVGGGVLGLVALLTPRFLAASEAPRDEHEARVHALRSTLAQREHAPPDQAQPDQAQPDHAPPGPGLATGNLAATDLDPSEVAAQQNWLRPAPVLTTAQRVLLPLAVVSSAAAAGVHAAVGPAHLRESLLFGAFFASSALLQLLWAGMAAVHSSRRLLVVGAVGNLAVIGLWAVTRTLGLPFGLLPRPEAVGPWDVACAGWELVVVCSCIAILQSRQPLPTRLVDWRHWHPALPTYVAASVLLLIALSVSGAGA
jgi:hypothetical protein